MFTKMIEDGSVICWGGNDHGQRGQKGQGEGKHPADSSLTILRDSVLPIGTNENYLLSCGSSHTVCISKDKVYVWGNGADGQLGTGDTHCRYQPTCISLPYDESVTSIAGVSCGTRHTIVWTDEASAMALVPTLSLSFPSTLMTL
ncbi:HERC1 [Bugula neritina]|uniref:HERC1 n=1 Tax=Bugula neritina TaxID=10212 RepID=A0A7J7K641_BUGNE|nr:HERC1 [Bugula neritina]